MVGRRATWRPKGLPAEVAGFVGRAREVKKARDLLGSARVVTLAGVGGVGKTRIALRVAHEVSHLFPGGVWWVDLNDVSEAATAVAVEQAVAEAIGLYGFSVGRPRDALVEYLRDRHCLLVLDNCEHVVDEVGALTFDLLRAAAELRVLATSRAMLGCPGEHVVHVPPMRISHADDLSGEPHGEALDLLCQRAGAIGAPISDDDLTVAAQLCRRLDGLPLAIELAAVRLGALSPTELLERLDDRFALLSWGSQQGTADRHTLRQVLAWSYHLCDERERLLWERASVFVGGFSLAAAETVCCGEDLAREEILDAITGLVRQSLLMVDRRDGHARYRMLDTVRHYGQHTLSRRGQMATYQRRHREYYQCTVAGAVSDWFGPRELQWLEWARAEMPNLRAAMDLRDTDTDAVQSLELASNLTRLYLWFFAGWIGEGLAWLRGALDVANEPSRLRVTALAQAGWLSIGQGDIPSARAILADCRAPENNVDGSTSSIDFYEGVYALVVEADARCLGALDRARAAGAFNVGVTELEVIWLVAQSYFGDPKKALSAAQKFLNEALEKGGTLTICWAQWSAGFVHVVHGDHRRALTLMRESLRTQREIREHWGAVWSIHGVALALAAKLRAESDPHDEQSSRIAQDIAQVLGGAYRMRQYLGVNLAGIAFMHANTQEAERAAQRVLSDNAYRVAFSEGTRPDLDGPQAYDHVIALALGEREPTTLTEAAGSADSAPREPLSAREQQIAALVSQGLNNLEIGRILVISHRTVQTHISNILRKRDLRNRQELAAWYVQQYPDRATSARSAPPRPAPKAGGVGARRPTAR